MFFCIEIKTSSTTLAISLDSSFVFTSVSLHANVIGLAFIYNKKKHMFYFQPYYIVLCVLRTYVFFFYDYYTFYNFVTNVPTKNFTHTYIRTLCVYIFFFFVELHQYYM